MLYAALPNQIPMDYSYILFVLAFVIRILILLKMKRGKSRGQAAHQGKRTKESCKMKREKRNIVKELKPF